MEERRLPLEGLKALELSTVVAAPTTARMLASYGADVIKVEALSGDNQRMAGFSRNVPVEDHKNPMFTIHNSNKRLTAIDIKSDEGRSIFLKLMGDADIFISNVRENSLRKISLDYESIKGVFPGLIYAQLYGYGPKGPASGDPGFDSTAFWMRSGPQADWTVAGEHPFYPAYAFGDMSTSSVLLAGILMALYAREHTGLGTMVNTSLFASGIWCNASGIVSTQFGKKHLNPDYLHPVDPFDTFYECSDGNWIAVYCNDYAKDRRKFAGHLGIEDILDDARWDSGPALEESGFMEKAVARVAAIFKARSAFEWRDQLSVDNISCEVMRRTCDVVRDEQALANGYVEDVEFAGGVKAAMPSPPIHFSAYGREPYETTGKIGEHTDAILFELGYNTGQIAGLREKGVVK
ncbi:MAG: CoA transferase [Clostridiales Family XIII bacterium]|jgi:crotonobetainyl-CoA:carnitine CoA-transferase CaiB-like acyl-CoA transferase|nr:CoA transferase [Clostridiales Family XIII bacterium]